MPLRLDKASISSSTAECLWQEIARTSVALPTESRAASTQKKSPAEGRRGSGMQHIKINAEKYAIEGSGSIVNETLRIKVRAPGSPRTIKSPAGRIDPAGPGVVWRKSRSLACPPYETVNEWLSLMPSLPSKSPRRR
jgi:hypothetical protein